MNKTINNNQVIVISGSGGCGKDTFVEFCRTYSSNVMNKSSVSYVKQVARYCGWNETKTEKDREFLSNLKDCLTKWNDMPFKDMEKFITACKNKIIFLHIREPKEIERMKKEYNARTLLILNHNVPQIKSNHADANVEDYNYDYIINNSGTLDDLKMSAKCFLKEISR